MGPIFMILMVQLALYVVLAKIGARRWKSRWRRGQLHGHRRVGVYDRCPPRRSSLARSRSVTPLRTTIRNAPQYITHRNTLRSTISGHRNGRGTSVSEEIGP